jgi:polysaccharide export outer membrane protein
MTPRDQKKIFMTLLAVTAFLVVNGCSAVSSKEPVANQVDSKSVMSDAKQRENSDLERLAGVWEKRRHDSIADDYAIGPGDLLEIHVPGLEEFRPLVVRVGGQGTITLPYVGSIKAVGMSEKALRADIRARLQKDIMHDPQVTLFARESPSRQVAVIGAVQKPGLYNLASSSDTIFNMISHAGGMRAEAAERILFIPAEPAEPEKAKELIASVPAQLIRQDASPLILKNVDPIVISLDNVIRGGHERYLATPARPGDVIMVPGSGEVLIDGWVEKPGSYKITPGLTVLGAIVAAGGPLFAADTSEVKIIRTDKNGGKIVLSADLEGIKLRNQPDLAVQEADVIEVPSSGGKLAAYGVYRLFTTLFHVGASATIPIR